MSPCFKETLNLLQRIEYRFQSTTDDCVLMHAQNSRSRAKLKIILLCYLLLSLLGNYSMLSYLLLSPLLLELTQLYLLPRASPSCTFDIQFRVCIWGRALVCGDIQMLLAHY